MKWCDVIDIWPRDQRAPADWSAPDLFVRVLSDLDEAPVGVVSMSLPTREHGPLLEKHLRDAGITEMVSTVLTHGIRRSGELARIFYTAVPASARLRRQRWARKGQHLFVYPVAALLGRVVTATSALAAAVLIKEGAALVLVAMDGEVRVAEWFSLVGAEEEDARRLLNVLRRDLAIQGDQAAQMEAGTQLHLFHVSTAEGETDSTSGSVPGQTARVLARMMEQTPLPAQCGQLVSRVQTASSLLEHAHLSDALQTRFDRLAFQVERFVPLAALAMALLVVWMLLGMVGAGWERDRQAQAFAEVQHRLGPDDRAEVERLSVVELERTQSTARVQELLDLREKAGRLPDLRRVLQDVRMAAPPTVRISEIGVAAGKDRSMVFITGTTQWSGQVLVDEQQLVSAMVKRGYTVQQREFFSASTSSGFRLALTWGSK